MMGWDDAAVAGGQIAGAAGQYFMNKELMRDQQDFNRDMMHDQMVWQESMSNTAHQREVADLKAAGLNPILSAGGGASSPSGSSATASLASPPNLGLDKIMSSAQAYQQGKAQLEATQAAIDKSRADQKVSEETAGVRAAERKITEAAAASAPAEAAFREKYKDYLGPASVLLPLLGQGLSSARDLGIFGAAAKNIFSGPSVPSVSNPAKIKGTSRDENGNLK